MGDFISYELLPIVFNMSVTASVVIVFVLLARLLLKKAPKIFSYALWAVVLFRLLCPVSITTGFSLLGLFDAPVTETTTHTTSVEYIPQDVVHTPAPEVKLPVPGVNQSVNEALPQGDEQMAADPLEASVALATLVWLVGIAVLAVYSVASLLRLRRRLVGAVPLRSNIYLADYIESPFVMGIFRPKIYLSSSLSEQEQGYIILHEQHHIRRGDHIIKALAFLALCIHWFNPLVWVAFILSSKDMEMSCDEAVVKKLGEEIRADYSASLLSLATGRRIIAGTPLAFGEGDTKSRIRNLLNWKKPTAWITVLATVTCMVIIAVCGTNAASGNWIHLEEKATESGAPRYTWNLEQPIRSWAIYEDVYSDGRLISSAARIMDNFVEDGGASGRNDSFSLNVMPIFAANDGYSNELKVVYEGAGTMEWTLILPHSHYSASVGHDHLSREPFDTRNRFKLENNDEIILYSQLFSTAEDSFIDENLLQNDTVVQYRLVTSTALEKEFNQQDYALELYELRIPILQSPETARPLVEKFGVDEWGTYTLDRWSDASGSALLIAFENAPEDEDALMRQMHPVVYLLTALIGDIDGVHYSFPAGEEQQELITVYDTHDADRYAEAIGFKDLKTVACSPVGIRILMEYLGWTGEGVESETIGHYGTAEDISYYLELAAGETFRDISLEKKVGLLVEYEDLLDDYTLIARESTDGKSAYIVGSYNGNLEDSPLHMMYSVEISAGENDWYQILYRETDSVAVDEALAAQKTPNVGYQIEDSWISFSDQNGIILIQPRDTDLSLDVALSRYLYTPNGRAYIADAASRGIAMCSRQEPFLYVYRVSEQFGEIAERIPLTKAEASAILAEECQPLTDGFGFAATLHMDGETVLFSEATGVPRSVLDLAVEKCDYKFADPSYIRGPILGAELDCDWLDTTLLADEADLTRLEEILKNAEFGVVGDCGYGARLTLSLTGGEKLTVFKGTDDCGSLVFGSYGGYLLGDKENREFWEIFGLDPETKARIEKQPEETVAPAALPTEADIHAAIMTNHEAVGDENALMPFYTEAHNIWSQSYNEDSAVVYAQVWYATYDWQNGHATYIGGRCVPAKIRFKWNDGWQLSEYWVPPDDGNYEKYAASIWANLPADIAHLELGETDSDVYADLNARCNDAAIRYYAAQTGLPPAKTFTPADVEFSSQALRTQTDTMTYEERLAWVQAGPIYDNSTNYTSLGKYREGGGCLVYLGQWVGTPHVNQYVFNIRFADGTIAYLPLADEGYYESALPDSMEFQNEKFVYETTFTDELLMNEGQELIHLKGTYHYEVDLAAKTVSLMVFQQ